MKHLFAPVLLGVFGLGMALSNPADAQVPFNSTSPPSPFNRSTGLPPQVAPTPQTNPQQGIYGSAGTNPGAYGVPGYTAPTVAIDPDHKLSRGDTLSYRVAEDRDNNITPLTVEADGQVEVPLIGRMKAQGKSTQQLTSDIKSALERDFYYHATVFLGLNNVAVNSSRGKVYVMGEVVSKGSVELPVDGELTLSQAILQLGGFTVEANQKKVVILRKGGPPKGIVVDVKAVLNGDSAKDVPLQPGDTVKVPKNFFNIQY